MAINICVLFKYIIYSGNILLIAISFKVLDSMQPISPFIIILNKFGINKLIELYINGLHVVYNELYSTPRPNSVHWTGFKKGMVTSKMITRHIRTKPKNIWNTN